MKVFLIPFLLSALHSSHAYDPPILATLKTKRSVSNSHSIKDYSYDYKRECFCTITFTGPFRITVRNDVVISVLHAILDLVVEPVPSSFEIKTADETFDFALELMRTPLEEMQDGFDATYNDVYSFPRSVSNEKGIKYKVNSFVDKTTVV